MGNGRGEIHNRARAKQINNFNGLCYGTITPTDIDGALDFHGKCFVYIELKYKDSPLPPGQRLFFQRIIDDHVMPTICIVGVHDVPSEKDVDTSICIVREYYFRGKWHTPREQYTVKRMIDDFVGRYTPECLHLQVESINV